MTMIVIGYRNNNNNNKEQQLQYQQQLQQQMQAAKIAMTTLIYIALVYMFR